MSNKKNRKKPTEENNRVKRKKIRRIRTNPETGLSAEQVRERVACGWENTAVEPPMQTTKEIIHENVFTYFNLIFAVLAVLLIIVGSFRNLTFLPVILFNTLIGIVQEVRANKTLKKMSLMNAPKAQVIRDGQVKTIRAEQVVIDDIVIFSAGIQICADAKVVQGEVRVNESLLTGESDEIVKQPGDTLMSGSFVVSGECRARLSAVGKDSYISKLTIEAKTLESEEQSEMIRALDRLVKFVGIALIPISIILFVQSYFYNAETFRESITSMVAAAIGMIPEGLYLLASVALAVSAMRLASEKVLLHDMKCIETLARVDVLCVDKTGTITEPAMAVKELIPVEEYNNDDMEELEGLIGDFASAMSADNATMAAIKEYFTSSAGSVAEAVFPFSSKNKYSGAVFFGESYVMGAPEFLLGNHIDPYRETIANYAKKGYRVLAFGRYEGELDGEPLKENVIPYAWICLANPIRKEAKETFTYFAEQGVEIKVISGDNPLTVVEAAKEAGIKNAENYVDATTLRTEKDIYDAMKSTTVFGRVTPEQKRLFVKALKAQGHTVAMTGDGVNDVLALKDADCSVAMASGSDAAAQAAQLVLLESDFSRMPSVVLEGRRVVNNIQRSASLFLVKNIFSFLLAIFSAVFMITYPLEPSQVSLISMFTIGVPAFFLALQPNKELIQGKFLTNVVLKALPAGLTDVLAVGALAVFGQTFGVGTSDIGTAATILLAIVGFMILYRICKPFNILRVIVWVGCVIGLISACLFVPGLFAITGMSEQCIMLFVVFAIATEPVYRYLTGGVIRLQRRIDNARENRKSRKGL